MPHPTHGCLPQAILRRRFALQHISTGVMAFDGEGGGL